MYYVKFYKKDSLYIYLYKEKNFIDKFLCFGEFINYLERNNINFKNVKFKNFNVDLLFYHFVDYSSLFRKFDKIIPKKMECEKNDISTK